MTRAEAASRRSRNKEDRQTNISVKAGYNSPYENKHEREEKAGLVRRGSEICQFRKTLTNGKMKTVLFFFWGGNLKGNKGPEEKID